MKRSAKRRHDTGSGQATARKAQSILVAKNLGFVVPTAKQRQNLLVAFAKKGKVVYGRAFDIVRFVGAIDLNDLGDVERNLGDIMIYEIKATRKSLRAGFSGFFFGLSGTEMLVAQSLRQQFRFAFVSTVTHEHLELSIVEIFSRAKGIYPTWSISF